MIDNYDNLLMLDLEEEVERITRFINGKRRELNRDGVIIGLSGGLDSAVVAYLTRRSISPDKITLLYLPERDSKKIHKNDAYLIAESLEIELRIVDISQSLKVLGVYDLLPFRFVPGNNLKNILVKVGKAVEKINQFNLLTARLKPKGGTLVAKGNAYGMIKHRMRMVMLYYEANIHNLMVIGAANKSELLTGTFSQWGCDQCADIMPIIHLYRSQVEDLAEYLEIPEKIRSKPADPDIMPGLESKEVLLGSFRELDLILHGLENNFSLEWLYIEFGKDKVKRILELLRLSEFMREAPYTLD